MSSSAQVGHFIGFQVALVVLKSDPSFVHSFTSLVGFNPMELAGLRKGSPSPLFKISMPSFGQPMATEGLSPHPYSH
eukprot:337137-Amphidinium_carterae.1